MKRKDYKIQVLKEAFELENSDISFPEFVKLTSESDPGFFRWLFDDEELQDFDEGQHEEEWKKFISEIGNESKNQE